MFGVDLPEYWFLDRKLGCKGIETGLPGLVESSPVPSVADNLDTRFPVAIASINIVA